MERDFTVVFRVRPSLLDNPSPTGLVEAASTGELKINEPLARKNFPEAFGEVKDEKSVAKGLKKKVRE